MAILQVKQKNFFWMKPNHCPKCGSRVLWGHGFVYRYFNEFPEALPLKRYRCPCCGAVHTMRPESFSEGFSVPTEIQYASIMGKLNNKIWGESFSRQIQQYWYRGFQKQVARISLHLDPVCFLDTACRNGFPFASHSLKYCVDFIDLTTPHLIFAATDGLHPP